MTSRDNLEPRFFAAPEEFREWLQEHHATQPEALVGFHRRATGRPSLTWAESVDEALCYGWIDGIRRGIDDTSYTIRFTPRKRRSTWSLVNIRRVAELQAEGRMRPAGMAAFEARDAARSGIYSHEQADAALAESELALLKANSAAWTYFDAQPNTYRRAATWWVVSARKPETRARRLETLIDDSAAGRRIRQLTWQRASEQ